MLTRIVRLVAMATLAITVLWRSSLDYRMPVSIVVSAGAIVLVVRSLSAGKLLWGLVFLGVLGVFTPWRSSQFSPVLVSILDLATLALFAVSPIVLRKSRTPLISSAPQGPLRQGDHHQPARMTGAD
jgi:hypothetical protein